MNFQQMLGRRGAVTMPIFKDTQRLVEYVLRMGGVRRYLTIEAIASSLIMGASIGITVVSGKLIDSLQFSAISEHVNNHLTRPLIFVIILAVLALANVSLGIVLALSKENLRREIAFNVDSRLMRSALNVNFSSLDTPEFHNTATRVRREGASSVYSSVSGLIQSSTTLMGALLSLYLMMRYSLIAGSILIVMSIPLPFVYRKILNANAKMLDDLHARGSREYYLSELIFSAWASKETRVFRAGNRIISAWDRERRMSDRVLLEFQKKSQLRPGAFKALAVLALYGPYAVFVYMVAINQMTLGELTTVFLLSQRLQGSLESLTSDVFSYAKSIIGYSLLHNFFGTYDQIESLVGTQGQDENVAMQISPNSSGVVYAGYTLEDVTFQYPGSHISALKDVTLTIPKGHSIAIVGENGCGKSTLAKILCGLYEPTGGTAYLDGIPISERILEWPDVLVSTLFQDYAKFQLRAYEAIDFGSILPDKRDQRRIEAANRGCIHDVIAKLPYEYDTQLGTMFPNGMNLSGGQWQRIALARALIAQPPYLIMDEPTSSVDVSTEERILNNILNNRTGQTVVLITHRMSFASQCDMIVMMESGSIIEQGTHKELYVNESRYKYMYDAQLNQFSSTHLQP